MPQKALKAKSHGKSAGAMRKLVGESKKKTIRNKNKKSLAMKARANYISSVESHMTSRVPSDQRGKLLVVKSSGMPAEKKNKKKPLTRGRKRKSAKKD